MTFTFKTAQEIRFGVGATENLWDLTETFGNKVLLVLDSFVEDENPLGLGRPNDVHIVRASGEPTVDGVRAAVEQARDFDPDVIVGIGGGSTIDTAKAIGILLGNQGDILDYLEVVGAGRELTARSLPVIAVPTTAGTGAEVTANSPIYSREHQVKASLRSPAMLPTIALVDPKATVTTPPSVTASAGVDALTQCLEPYTSIQANPLTDILAKEGLRRASTSLRAAFDDGENLEARTDMAMCSLLGGMSLANAKLGAVHGLAAPFGGMLAAAHGEVCAALLAAATEVNIQAMLEREPDNPALTKYEIAARILTGNDDAGVEELIAWIAELVDHLGVRSLSQLGLDKSRVLEAAEKGAAASSMKGNPIKLTLDEVQRIVEDSM